MNSLLILWDQNVYYGVYKNPSPVLSLIQINPFYVLPSYACMIYDNIILPYTSRSSECLFNVHGPVHLNNILIYIQQDATLHSLFCLETAVHVSGGTTTHHQERKQMYLQHLVFVTPLLLSAAIVEELELV